MSFRKLKIGIIAACPFPANHGTPALIREMSLALRDRGHEIHVITYPMSQDIPVDGISIHRTGRLFRSSPVVVGPTFYRPFLDLMLIFRGYSVARQYNLDVIHAINYEGALAGYPVSRLAGKPLLYEAVNTMISELPTYRGFGCQYIGTLPAKLLDWFVPRLGDRISCLSEELYGFLQRQGIPHDLIDVVPAPLDMLPFENLNGTSIRQHYHLEDIPLIMYTGTMDRFQGIDSLIHAMIRVRERVAGARLLIVGGIVKPYDLSRCKLLARELGIEDAVMFTDERPYREIPSFLNAADVVVNPRNDCPGYPVKLLNYMASGRALVTFAGSAKDLRHDVNALIVANGDWCSFGDAIVELLLDHEKRQRLGANAREYCRHNHSPGRIATHYEEIYHKLVEGRLST